MKAVVFARVGVEILLGHAVGIAQAFDPEKLADHVLCIRRQDYALATATADYDRTGGKVRARAGF